MVDRTGLKRGGSPVMRTSLAAVSILLVAITAPPRAAAPNWHITESKGTFAGPESSVEMEVMRGFEGRPVKVLNLPNAAYQDYTQYKSVSHKHTSEGHTFSHSGTNGFTSTMDVGSKP